MSRHEAAARVVVVGASAGGAETVRELVAGLPADLDAAVAIVMHLHPGADAFLVSLLASVTELSVRGAEDGALLRSGEIVVACADRHLELHDGHIRVTSGPRENGFRPSVDTLFRTAAQSFGSCTIGVVLSGMLDDGAFGLRTIRGGGGLGLVQDPQTAIYPDMPRAAIEAGGASEILTVPGLTDAIIRAVSGGDDTPREEVDDVDQFDVEPHADSRQVQGDIIPMVCPSCGGNLWQQMLDASDPPAAVQFRCRTGHRFSPHSLFSVQGAQIEDALWGAYRSLLERVDMTRRMAERFAAQGLTRPEQRWHDLADEAEQRAGVIRAILDQA